MLDRERLIEIVKSSLIKHIDKSCCLAENIVDDLLAENVTVSPVAFSDNRRERMIELLNGYYEETGLAHVHYFTDEESEMLADYILSDGWIRPPCKVGDSVYMPWEWNGTKGVAILTVTHIITDGLHSYIKAPLYSDDEEYSCKYGNGRFLFDDFGKTVFLTPEEAEKAQKGGAEKCR